MISVSSFSHNRFVKFHLHNVNYAIIMFLQLQHDKIVRSQQLLDSVTHKAQALLETNSDAQVSHSITQLTTSYHTLLTASKELVKRVEKIVADHCLYNTAVEEFQAWLTDTSVRIDKLTLSPVTSSNYETSIAAMRVS